MSIEQIATIGDKIDIQLVQQLEQVERGEATTPLRTYKSSLFDNLNENEIEIAMPTENGRMVLFQIGLRCRLLFYTQKGMYTCYGTVQKRYKKENFFILAILLTSDPVKFQRREFFRIEKNLDIKYLRVSDDIVEKDSTEAIYAEIHRPGYLDDMKDAVTMDLSGGGIRFAGDEILPVNSYVLVIMRLCNEKIDQTFYLIVQVVDSFRSTKNLDKVIVRGRFLFKDLKDRETIVRYIFEEERKIRRKEMGE